MDFDDEECGWSFDDAVDEEEDFTCRVPHQLDFMEGPPEEEPDIEPEPPTDKPDPEPTAGSGTVVFPMALENDEGSLDVKTVGPSGASGSSGEALQAIGSRGAGNDVARESTAKEATPEGLSPQGSPSEPTAAAEEKSKKFRRLSRKTKVPVDIVPVRQVGSKQDLFLHR